MLKQWMSKRSSCRFENGTTKRKFMENKIHIYLLQSLCKTHLKKKTEGEVFPVTSMKSKKK